MHDKPLPSSPEERLPELDALRGIAAFAVLIHHAIQLLPPLVLPDLPWLGWLRYTLVHLTPLRVIEFGRPAVLFFFVLSGYVLTRALLRNGSPGLPAYAAQRTIRLGVPVVVSVLLSVLLWALFSDPDLPQAWRNRSLYTWLVPPTLTQVLSNALLLAPNDEMRLNGVLWSLVHEWRLSLLLPLVLLFRGRVALFGATVLAAMWLGIMGGALENRVQLGPHLHSTVPATFYFSGGIGAGVAMALALGRDVPLLCPTMRRAAGLAALALFGMASDLAVYGGSLLLILVARQPGRLRAALRRPLTAGLGAISFSLYLVHVPVLVALLHQTHDAWPPLAIALGGVALALAAALVMYALVEVPSRRLARAVERRLSARGRRRQPPGVTADIPPQPELRREWAPEGGIAVRL